MIQPDTIKLLTDSTKGLSSDSAAKLDTILRVDSTQLLDTVKAIIQAPRGHLGIPHPPFPQTDVWVFGVLLFLFVLLIFSISQSSSAISETIKTIFQAKERNSLFGKTTISNFRFRFFLIEFSVGVISLYAYLFFLTPGTSFTILKYGYFFLATSLFFGLKSVLFSILGYVFFDFKDLKMAKESYFNIMSLLGVALFPIIIFQIYLPYNIESISQIISLVLFVIAYVFVVIKLFQIFFHKIVASFYILLYLCTLEFLPLFALYQVYNLIV
jgi:hypothetical protein